MDSLVSIIVPIYKVEKYLATCLNSIASQTFTNIQVILVNDGSPDNSQSICKKYCENDTRFELINKENGGLASARNAGLEKVKGDYIVCVDSDDWIEPNMVELLLKNMVDYKADMSVCSFYVNEGSSVKKEFFSKKISVLSQQDAIKNTITPGKFYGFAWNKMYKTELVADQRYDESILKGEDSPFSCEYILKCKKIVVQDIPLYHYRNDSVSISRSKFNIGKMSVLKSYQSIVDMLVRVNYSNDIIDMQRVQYANQLLSLRTNIILSGKSAFLPQLDSVDKQLKEYEKLYLKSKYIDVKHKIAYELGVKFRLLFDATCKIYGFLR
jgi:glycosyltransferase involved in cell wall biosynthesis